MPNSATSGEPEAPEGTLRRSGDARRGPGARTAVRISTVLGLGLAIGGSVFVVRTIVSGWSDHGDAIAAARWGWVVAGLALGTLGMTSMGLVWRHVVLALGGEAARREIFAWYQIGNLGKYLPGAVWPLVGRSEMAVRGGLERPIAYNSVALSIGAAYLSATVVCALLLPFVVIDQGSTGIMLWVFALIPVGLAALHPAVLGRVFRIAERVLGKGAPALVPSWLTSVGLVLRYALPWLAIGVAVWLVAIAFDPGAPLLPLVFAGILSWMIGFAAFIVPGGIGVREAAFTAIASVALSAPIAATVAIVSRLVFVAADALGAGVAAPLVPRRQRRAPTP